MTRAAWRGARILAAALGLVLACADSPSPSGVPDAEVPALLAALEGGSAAEVETALERIVAAEDRRFVPVLIELVRANQIGIAGRDGYNPRVIALERLSGERHGGDWFAWAEWYAGTDLEPPPGFTGWKGRLFAALDPRYEEILRDGLPTRLRVESVDWGGVPVDGIPPLDDPKLLSAERADYLGAEDAVFGLQVNGEARAYPLRILDWHELANDTVGGVPLALAYCTLCGSGIAYDRRLPDGRTLTFSTSGLLDRSNTLMLDRETGTLWNQLTGRPVLGPLAEDGDLELARHPLVVDTWGRWSGRHPATGVLSLETGHERNYEPGNPYGGYFASPRKLFPVFEGRDDLPSKERVFGLVRDGAAKAWPIALLAQASVRNDRIGDEEIVLVTQGGAIAVDGQHEALGPVRYEAGAAVRASASGDRRFRRGPDPATLLDDSDALWLVSEDALVGQGGARAPRLAGTLAYWFAWQSFHPTTALAAE